MGKIFSLTSDEAEIIIAEAIRLLKLSGYAACVSLVNRDGTEIARTVMDGAKPFTQNVALLKAKQAVWVGKPTGVTRDEIKAGEKTAEVLGLDPAKVVPWKGGRPIYDYEGHLLGGIGVSNLDEADDDSIAENALLNSNFKAAA